MTALEEIVNSIMLFALRHIIWPGKRNNEYVDALKIKTISVASVTSQLLALDNNINPGDALKMHIGIRNYLVEYASSRVESMMSLPPWIIRQ